MSNPDVLTLKDLCLGQSHGHLSSMYPFYILARLFVAAVVSTTAFTVHDPAQGLPIVDVGYAKYQGTVSSTGIGQFLGIRYAAPPTGHLRFRAPQRPRNITGLQNATSQPMRCYQTWPYGVSPTNPFTTRKTSAATADEDCLFLNVYYPVELHTRKRPVLVYIHGGGYAAGRASIYNGEDVIKQSNRGLVVVIIQYRLGLFGFLAGEAVKQDGHLNAGLLDQEFALRWVHEHIEKFGGDPSKVTIWGESAGAGSVLQHIIANDGKTEPPLFRAAMTSSIYLPPQYDYNARIPELLFMEVATQTNCSSSADAMKCLRTVNIERLQAINKNVNAKGFFGTFSFVPVVDGQFVQQRPSLALAEGKVNGESVLAVTNSFEGTFFVNQSTAWEANATRYALNLFPNLDALEARQVGAVYEAVGAPIVQENIIHGEAIFVCPTYFLLEAFNERAFKAEFAIPPGLHADDVNYYWPSFAAPPFQNTTFIDAFAQIFTAFAMHLDPNMKVNPATPTMTPNWMKWGDERTEMLFNKTDTDIPVIRPVGASSALLHRCGLWHGLSTNTAQ
ncbi:Alpha/Beta hydrolase protein [Mycena amicta]|nr:Alpha/Beta hydrolase protein [Mycena amicta]